MTQTREILCSDDRRRSIARADDRNGIDSISVSEDQLRISVILFGKAPAGLDDGNIRIDGEPGSPVVTALSVVPCPDPDPEDSDCLLVHVDGPGDWSCYTLAIVEEDPHGRPGTTPYQGFDQRHYSMPFTFKQNCPHPLDCAGDCTCDKPRPLPDGPVIDYLSRDYGSLRQQLLDRLTLTLPDWTERHEADVGITLVELLAYAGDLLNYRLDAVGTEAFLDTARLRRSVRRHARLVDYRMHDGAAARAFVCLDVDQDVTIPAGTIRFRADTEAFEPLVPEDLRVVAAHGRIGLWTWGNADCCMPAGTTEAFLVDDGLELAPGDLVLFEEVLGAVTGLEADADPDHRQVVRLVEVEPAHDDLLDQALLKVRWADADALTFPLCVTSRGGPDCTDLTVGVARGNVVVVGHGATTTWCQTPPEQLDWPDAAPTVRGCPCLPRFGCPTDGAVDLPAYPPRRVRREVALASRPVTQQAPWPDPAAVAAAQADALGGLPVAGHDRIVTLLAREELEDADLAWLTTLFGPATIDRYDVREHPQDGLRALLARFDRLLETKLDRLDQLRCRARAGYVLRQAVEGQEIAWSWGVDDLIDPARPRVRGPAATVCAVDPRAALPVVEVWDTAGTRWTPVRDLLSSGPADPVLVGETDDEQTLWLRFGDGRQGLPPASGDALVASYKVGNGRSGNVGPGAIDTVELCGVDAGEIRVRNPLPACGGTDPETIAEARQRAPREALAVLARAVTADDYARVAGELAGVQRAACALRWTGSWYEAQVAIDALGTESPPAALITAERERLHRYRRIGHDVVVRPADLVSLDLALCVRVEPDHITGHVRGAVADLLGARSGPNGLAFFAPDRLTFGTPVRLSAVVAAVSEIPGVAGVKVTRLRRQFGPFDDRALTDGVLALGDLEVARLDNDASRPDHAVVALVIGGGR
jgi:predicted phage baseplate assembly protein